MAHFPVLAGCPEAGRRTIDAANTVPRSRDGRMSESDVLQEAGNRYASRALSRQSNGLGRRLHMGLGIIGWIVIGIVAGWLAEKVMGRSHGLLTNLIVGVVGALLGGFIAGSLLNIPVGGFNLITLLVAFLGACLLLFLVGLVKRRT